MKGVFQENNTLTRKNWLGQIPTVPKYYASPSVVDIYEVYSPAAAGAANFQILRQASYLNLEMSVIQFEISQENGVHCLLLQIDYELLRNLKLRVPLVT